MNDPFETSKFSIAWANHHIAELTRELEIFLNDEDGYAIVTERDADGTYDLIKFKLRKAFPLTIRGHASDAANNLRSALDKTICTIFDLKGLPTYRTYFPIGRDSNNFEKTLNGWRGQLPQEISDLIRGLKPYKGGNNTLWALNALSGTNKHGILRPELPSSQLVQASGTHRGRPLQFPLRPQWDSTKDEMVLIRVPVTDGEFTVNYDYSFFIAFNEIEFIDGKEIVSTLNQFADIVEGIVMAIEAEACKLGLV